MTEDQIYLVFEENCINCMDVINRCFNFRQVKCFGGEFEFVLRLHPIEGEKSLKNIDVDIVCFHV